MMLLKKLYPVVMVPAVLTIYLPSGAQAQEMPTRGPIPFAVYDMDANGVISEEEFNKTRAKRISQRAAEGRPMRGAADAPGFSAFDTDGDGQLTPSELQAGQQAQMEKRRNMGMGQGRGMGQGAGKGRDMPAFADYDLDGDGKIGEKEFNEARGKRISERTQQGYQMRNLGRAPSFSDIDTNGDGAISPEEFSVHQSQHRQQGAE